MTLSWLSSDSLQRIISMACTHLMGQPLFLSRSTDYNLSLAEAQNISRAGRMKRGNEPVNHRTCWVPACLPGGKTHLDKCIHAVVMRPFSVFPPYSVLSGLSSSPAFSWVINQLFGLRGVSHKHMTKRFQARGGPQGADTVPRPHVAWGVSAWWWHRIFQNRCAWEATSSDSCRCH